MTGREAESPERRWVGVEQYRAIYMPFAKPVNVLPMNWRTWARSFSLPGIQVGGGIEHHQLGTERLSPGQQNILKPLRQHNPPVIIEPGHDVVLANARSPLHILERIEG